MATRRFFLLTSAMAGRKSHDPLGRRNRAGDDPFNRMVKLNLGQPVQCPTCEHGAMKTPKDFARNCCDFCWMTKHDGLAIEAAEHELKLRSLRDAT